METAMTEHPSYAAQIAGDAEPQPWMPPEPRELPALRQALAEQMRSRFQYRCRCSYGRPVRWRLTCGEGFAIMGCVTP